MTLRKSIGRCNKILRVACRQFIIHLLCQRLARWTNLVKRIPGYQLTGPERFRKAIEEVGATFIKFGQMMALQSDLLPLEYCRALFTLFDRVPSFPYEQVEQIFLEDLGRKPSEIYDSFDPNPVATGSIGQVHVAMLQGHKVAVKVMRPTIQADFHSDIAALKFLMSLIKLLRLRFLFWIFAPTEEFIVWTQDELDFRREAHYMDELERNARDNPNEKVPVVYWSCTTARILSVEFLEGVTIAEHLRNEAARSTPSTFEFDPDAFGSRLVDNFLGDSFRHGMFHADLHPGNLMIMAGNVVGYIDFGISGVLSRYSRRHLISMTLAYARGDLETICESFFQITTFAGDANFQGFRQGLKEVAAGWYQERPGEPRLRRSITLIMLDLLILSRENGLAPQRDVMKYIRSAVALDGLVKTFTPNMDVGQHLERACMRHIKQDALKNLISSDTLGGWFQGSRNLAHDGILRAFAALRHLGRDDSEDRLSQATQQRARKSRSAIGWLSIVWTASCAAMMLWPDVSSFRNHYVYAMAAAVPALLLVAWQVLKSARTV